MSQPNPNQLYTLGTGTASTDRFIAVVANTDPSPSDINYPIQKRWINRLSNSEFFLANLYSQNNVTYANWIPLSGTGSTGIQTLTGNTGGAVGGSGSPSNVNIVGDGTTIQVVGNPLTSTLDISFIGSVSGINQINQIIFFESGTYNPPSNMVQAIVECISAGGQGGCPNDTSSTHIAGGGGAGQYGRGVVTYAQASVGITCTVGVCTPNAPGSGTGADGGDTSFGSYLITYGGKGGTVAQNTAQVAFGGFGGNNPAPLVGFGSAGATGETGYEANTSLLIGGAGGNSYFGGGAQSTIPNSSAGIFNGAAASTFGGGGGGGISNVGSSGAAQGGAGGPGLIIITEFLS